MEVVSVQGRPTEKLLPALALILPSAVMAETGFIGLSVEESINQIAEDGLSVFYSSDLVRSSMMVLAEPVSQNSIDTLTEILAPHGLMLRVGFNDSWLVVRAPVPRPNVAAVNPPQVATRAAARQDFGPLPIEQVVVTASHYEIRGARPESLHALSGVDLEFSPDMGDDAIRAAARLPGMASNGLSARANIRGGEIRETLVRLDGIRLYDPFHLRDFQGPFSVIDPRIVESMDVYTGAYPVRLAGRMSGVIDVNSIAPPQDLHHEIGISFFNSSVLSAGRFSDGKGEWVASARRSNIDVLYDRFSEQPERPRYTDVFSRVSFDLSEKLEITGSVLQATDKIALADDVDREERATARQTDSYGWLRLDHRLSGQTEGVTLLASTNVTSFRDGSSEKIGVSSGWLVDSRSFSIQTLRSEWSRILGARLLLEFGGEVSRLKSRYDYEDAVAFDLLFDVEGAPTEISRSRFVSVQPRGRQFSLFSALRFDLSPRLATEFGVRWNEQTIEGGSSTTTEPRVGLRFAITEKTSVRASAGRFFQFQGIDELQVNDGLSEFFAPQQAEHLVLGLDRRLAGGTMLRVEAYRKALNNLRPRFENMLNSRVLLPELKSDRIRIAPESAEARGVEISLDGESNALRWWASVGWARVEDHWQEADILRSWDQTWTLNAGTRWERGQWNVSTGLVYRSGWPTTSVNLDSAASFPTASVALRNSDRMRPYASVDVRAGRVFQFDQGSLDVFFEVANLFGRSNPCCFEYEVGDEEDAGSLVLDERGFLSTIPSVGFTWRF